MNEKNEFLSIGELSKISGVNINSLRYYEQIGILIPAYVNPESGYRYYSLAQIHAVEVIRTCVSINMPLKDLKDFVDHASLLDYGEDLVKRNIQALQYRLDFIHSAQEEVKRIKKYKDAKEPFIRNIPEKFYYVFPYEPEQGKKAFYTEIGNLFNKSNEEDIEIFYEWGILYEYLPNETKRYIFTEIKPTTSKNENIKVIPSGDYICSTFQSSQIEKAPELFPELFKEKDYVLVIETEASFDTYQENKPIHELRVWMEEQNS